MNKELIDLDQRLTEDLELFCKLAPLKIKHKDQSKGVVPLVFNNAQRIAHEKTEAHLKRNGGKVRVIYLKGRQQGLSTYIGARYYHKTSRRPANNTFIMTHLADATSNLFAMTKRYHEHVDERLQTKTNKSSTTEMEFEDLDSNYRVATAGSKQSGRSYTITNFHASEYAFYPYPEMIKTGAMQAVPDAPGTEIIIESTANGMNNDFYSMCMNAQMGVGEYELIFIPWFVQEEYRKRVPVDVEWTKKEVALKTRYDLDWEQVYWRRRKIDDDFSGKESSFMQEYPCNVQEAFQASDSTLISVEHILDARKRTVIDHDAPLVMGVDPAHRGDRAVIALRQGRHLKSCIVYDTKKDPMEPAEFVDEVAQAISEHKPDKVFVDKGENGLSLISSLHRLGFQDKVLGVDFGQRALQSSVYENKRAEIWVALRDWIEKEQPKIPDDDSIQADLLSMPDYEVGTNNKIHLMPKKQIIKEFKMSPDIGDAIALTFSYPLDPLRNNQVKQAKSSFKAIRSQQQQVRVKGQKRKTIKH